MRWQEKRISAELRMVGDVRDNGDQTYSFSSHS
jgi:hypothetical protein